MKKTVTYGALLALMSLLAVSWAGAQDDPLQGGSWQLGELDPLPLAPDPPVDLPVQLILDDDSLEGTFGVSNGQGQANQFMWLNQFILDGLGPIELGELWVLFPPGDNMSEGSNVQLAVYHDTDDDPVNGAELLETFDVTVQVVDGATFSVYDIDSLPLPLGGYLLVGVVPRFIQSGVTTNTNPAALDTTASQTQSWLAVWSTDPPADLSLTPDIFFDRIDTLAAGNFAVRAFGRDRFAVEVPTLNGWAFLALVWMLAAAGWWVLRRRDGIAR